MNPILEQFGQYGIIPVVKIDRAEAFPGPQGGPMWASAPTNDPDKSRFSS